MEQQPRHPCKGKGDGRQMCQVLFHEDCLQLERWNPIAIGLRTPNRQSFRGTGMQKPSLHSQGMCGLF